MAKKIVVFLICIILVNIAIGQAEDIYIDKIVTDDSKILSSAVIEDIIAAFEGKKIDMKVLQGLVKKINDLYIEKGYITARAILPPQEIKNGIVRIKLVEGRVGEILIENNENTRDSFFLKRISLKSDDLIKLDSLERNINYFNRTNDVQISAKLKSGKKFAETDIVFNVKEPDNIQTIIFCDNGGRNETGEWRTGMAFTDKSLFRYRDRFNINLIATEGSTAGAVSYNFPLNISGTRLSMGYNKNQTDIISGEFKDIDIDGDFTDLNISINHPLRIDLKKKVYGYLELHNTESGTMFSGVELLRTRLQSFVLGVSTQFIDKKGVWVINHDLTHTRSDTDKRFLKYNGTFLRQQRFKWESILQFKGLVQYSKDDLLPSPDQFQLGGMSTVRGYPGGKLSGDKGYLLSLQLMKPLTKKIEGIIFIDHGGVFPYKGNDEGISDKDFISSIGIGANINFLKNSSGKFIYGKPIKSGEEANFHIFIQQNF
ncbi:ShlB/FhaC/HecB family hemolysin secretion/activation protein [Halocella sp. SP3-1]|uniref:ShlB/FhaC/HecB family hemolysin secretion/activation protein n=1 Tax=Halocella sp. SP3-1 TaxID=2382161 RepID=UPI000F753755|nr:ShlB/FhaC/HecB family hemolysin secretion/activation protein [Halocella sp. SP3-1]AZO95862.1 ShlB/FhaC/HecB family hemolysin secretion/activation protein [Halocella sp. SP3-1]